MQIRERATTWALIRTKYDKSRKRGVARCLGTISKATAVASQELAAVLSEGERLQVERMLRDFRARRESSKREHYAAMLPTILEYATAFYNGPTGRVPNLEQLARETRDEFSKLLAAMVAAGVGRRRKRRLRRIQK